MALCLLIDVPEEMQNIVKPYQINSNHIAVLNACFVWSCQDQELRPGTPKQSHIFWTTSLSHMNI